MSKTNNDTLIQSLMLKVESQKAALGTKKRKVLQTNGLFRNGNETVNLNTVSDPVVLAKALGAILTQEDAFEESCVILGIEAKFEWDGYQVEDWIMDFKDRIATIEYDKKKKALEDTQKKLASLISEDAKTQMQLAEIEKLLA